MKSPILGLKPQASDVGIRDKSCHSHHSGTSLCRQILVHPPNPDTSPFRQILIHPNIPSTSQFRQILVHPNIPSTSQFRQILVHPLNPGTSPFRQILFHPNNPDTSPFRQIHLLFRIVSLHLGLHLWEEKHILDRMRIGKNHCQSIHPYT